MRTTALRRGAGSIAVKFPPKAGTFARKAAKFEAGVVSIRATLKAELDAREIDKLFLRKGTCYSLWKKIPKGYALRLYDKIIKDDLEIIRRVRNAFAQFTKSNQF